MCVRRFLLPFSQHTPAIPPTLLALACEQVTQSVIGGTLGIEPRALTPNLACDMADPDGREHDCLQLPTPTATTQLICLGIRLGGPPLISYCDGDRHTIAYQ